jgi:hypothetical protein
MSTASEKVLKILDFIKRKKRKLKISYEETFDLLYYCVENIASDQINTEIALTYIVNFGFPHLINIVLSKDRALLNKLFDPLNIESHSSTVISKTVFDNIASRITRKTREQITNGHYQHDIYTFAAILEVSEPDFELILKESFTKKKQK